MIFKRIRGEWKLDSVYLDTTPAFVRVFLEYFRDVPFQQEVSQELMDWLNRPDVLNDYANWDEEQALIIVLITCAFR